MMPTFNEYELQRALAGAAATIQPADDPRRLGTGMARADRLRRIRHAGAGAALCVTTMFGVFVALPDGDPPPIDVRDATPDEPGVPAPGPETPEIGLAGTDLADTDADDRADPEPVATPVGDPDHLAAAPADQVAPPAEITLPTTTTTPPPTTAPPATTHAPTTTHSPTTTAAPGELTASARYGSCEEDPPYDEYEGTAAPGATVTITSPWSAPVAVTADAGGHWSTRVEFPDSPVGVPFTVTAGDGTSSVGLGFVRTG